MIEKKIPIIIFTGPSGVGKGTVERLLFEFDELNLSLSCSVTTRKPRSGEVHGIHYYFLDKALVQQKIKAREFLEFSYHFGNYYGTLYSELEKINNKGKNPMLEIETQGAMQILKKLENDPKFNVITIFLLPPTIADLKERIIKRGSEDDDTLRARLEKAEKEIEESTVFKYRVYNHTPEQAAEEIRNILHKELEINDFC
ncbi:guanylate kinase [Mycoplasmopsis pullorum]|uniref:guanylate kinase n=1 Tax=Mycoplasmopsis pullorum TaxID=48003 RepID=UPI00111BA8F1|nr:guanylate kinase [Mycoplasmopsis pullorum]TNK81902.1 guanylate kinase [Mycoplasmopsis pullorum]TNK83202.1 guanylate kinase [Mycoplasmopsis pullorum]TNK83305.1 guanylate kinase [Mycoplasmopsis pullorum]TNK84511.1 guanylate kinase [Mycoplasmopsis pullorum]TNK85426.1 guanylate kinase [Mycoplasmopsis pullorum]